MKILTIGQEWKRFCDKTGLKENMDEREYHNSQTSFYAGFSSAMDIIFGDHSDSFVEDIQGNLDIFASEMDDFLENHRKQEKRIREENENLNELTDGDEDIEAFLKHLFREALSNMGDKS